VDRRPDAHPRLGPGGRTPGLLVERQRLAEPAHVLDRDDDRQLERLAGARIDDPDLAPRSDPAQEAGDRLEGSLGRRQADPLEGRLIGRAESLKPFEAEREMGAPLRAGDRVDLVDDHVLDVPQALARLARQEQVKGLGRGDQDVRRAASVGPALLGARVAGPQPDRDRRDGLTATGGRERDPGQRRPEVPLDVVGQGLERRDVEDPDVTGVLARRGRGRVAHEPIEAPQERGEGLAAPGRGVDQGVVTGRDGRPALDLGASRFGERRAEPIADRRAERPEWVGVDGRPGRRPGRGRRASGHGRSSIGADAQFEQMIESEVEPATRCARCLHICAGDGPTR